MSRTVPTIIETDCGVIIVPLPPGTSRPTPSVTSLKTDPGPTAASRFPDVTELCPKPTFNEQPAPRSGCGTLSVQQTKAVMAQIGFAESGSDYAKVDEQNRVGKYQMHPAMLEALGYLKKGSTALVDSPPTANPNWTRKNGAINLNNFLSATTLQESIMYESLVSNYDTLISLKGLYLDDSPCTVAGMLIVAHKVGAVAARAWRTSGEGLDSNNVPCSEHFNRGRYAVSVLTPPARIG